MRQLLDQFSRARRFIVFVIADRTSLDPVVVQQLLRLPCVFARDQVGLLQDANRAQRDVLEVADGRCDEIKRRREIAFCCHTGECSIDKVMSNPPVLIIFGGLSGVGKTTIARQLARQIGAAYVRIDSIEQALRNSGKLGGDMDDSGYQAAYGIAEEHLHSGRSVIADCVNPLRVTRDAWRAVAEVSGARLVEVELVCSDKEEHRRRVEERGCDIPGLRLPTWEEILAREYEPWDRAHLVIDTAHCTVSQAVNQVVEALNTQQP